MFQDYEMVAGLEVHAQLLTQTKLFCGDSTLFGKEPNTQTSVISLGHPGTLPRLNKQAIKLAITLGLACHSRIEKNNYFARKNYFYPDLPKGYQVTQHTTPICKGGFLEINTSNGARRIRLNRIHIEEDAGKSIHINEAGHTGLDYNRAGMPLLEIVSEPDIRSAEEAFVFVSNLRKLVRHLGVCDGNMEEGSFRCDVNISVRKKGDEKLGTRVEIKNLNSLRFIKKAMEHETARLISLLEAGQPVLQQTRGFNENDFSTYAIRTKEDEDDYRYFPEPDLPPFQIDEATIELARKSMPPLQEEIKNKLEREYNLPLYDAVQLSNDSDLSELFFKIASLNSNYKAVANWVTGPVRNYILSNEASLDQIKLEPSSIAQLIALIDQGKINHGTAQQKLFPVILEQPELHLESYIDQHELSLESSTGEMDEWIRAALLKHESKIIEYNKGKKGLLSVFVGEVMKLSKGRADARLVNQILSEKLNKHK